MPIKRREYRNILYKYDEVKEYKNVKCLKIIFSENNWYLADEIEEREFRLFRISFIEKVSYSLKNSYQKRVLKKYEECFKQIENPMTLCNKEPKRAKIKAHKEIAKYFKGDMKQFFNS